MSQNLRLALAPLLHARQYAQRVGRRIWEFAIEIEQLRSSGLTNSDLRYLLSMRYAAHAIEVTPQNSPERVFHEVRNLMLTDKTCFVITKRGESAALEATAASGHLDRRVTRRSAQGDGPAAIGEAKTPEWLDDRRELWLGDQLIKQYRLPAANQVTILRAFEEEGWPPRIADPLPPRGDEDPRRRLHDAIHKLNRNQIHPLVRFSGCWFPPSVFWALTSCPASSKLPPSPPR
jgi:hypothetical protein